MGTISSSRSLVSTKPPTCWERWRGNPISSLANSRRAADRRIEGIELALPHLLSLSSLPQLPHTAAGEIGGDIFGQAEDLTDFADGAARTIVDDGCGERRAVMAVAAINY